MPQSQATDQPMVPRGRDKNTNSHTMVRTQIKITKFLALFSEIISKLEMTVSTVLQNMNQTRNHNKHREQQ